MPLQNASLRHLNLREVLALRLIPDEGLYFEESLPKTWLNDRLGPEITGDSQSQTSKKKAPIAGIAFKATAPGDIDLKLEPLAPMHEHPPIRLTGTWKQKLETTCVRCAETIEIALITPIELTLAPEPAVPKNRAETSSQAKTDEDDDFAMPENYDQNYDPDGVDLPTILIETLLLELPSDPICTDQEACEERTQELLQAANQQVQNAEEQIQSEKQSSKTMTQLKALKEKLEKI